MIAGPQVLSVCSMRAVACRGGEGKCLLPASKTEQISLSDLVCKFMKLFILVWGQKKTWAIQQDDTTYEQNKKLKAFVFPLKYFPTSYVFFYNFLVAFSLS